MTKSVKDHDILYDPQQVGTLAIGQVEYYQKNQGLRTGYPRLDRVMNPMRPGQLIPVLGYTNNFKSGLMDGIAQNVTRQIAGEPDSIVVYCTWEDTVDTIGIKNIAAYSHVDVNMMVRGTLNDGEWKRLRKASIERAKKPIWLVGHSTQQYRRRQRATLKDVWDLMDYVVDVERKNIALIIIDYLQRVRPHTRGDRRMQMMSGVDFCTDMALAFNAPLLLGTQSGRQVLSRDWKMPQVYDGQETSNIEQSASAFLSVYMPVKTEGEGEFVDVGGRNVLVTQNLLLLGLLKQKNGPAPEIFGFEIDFATNQLSPLDQNNVSHSTERYDLDY